MKTIEPTVFKTEVNCSGCWKLFGDATGEEWYHQKIYKTNHKYLSKFYCKECYSTDLTDLTDKEKKWEQSKML